MDENFMLEKMEINKRLGNLEISHAEVKIKVDSIDEKVDSIYKSLIGSNGAGLVVKIDRLEQVEKNKRIHYAAMWSAMAGLLIVRAWDFITGNHK